MRSAAVFEMSVVYACLILFVFAAAKWKKSLCFWFVTVFSVWMILIYALVIVNVGTLYRVRYPFLMTICAFGIAGALSTFSHKKRF